MTGKLPSGWFEKIAKEEGASAPVPSAAPGQPVQPPVELPVRLVVLAPREIEVSVVHNIPWSQVHPGSVGGHAGRNHIKFEEPFSVGKLRRTKGQLLCGRKVWDLRKPDREDTEKCPKCVEMAARYFLIPWPEEA